MYNKFLAVFLLIFISSAPMSTTGYANEQILSKQRIEAKELDERAQILTKYLAHFNSPLQNHAQDFVDAADAYGINWKLVPAIAGVESTFGKAIPGGYNGWGWGVYGDNTIYFRSWREGIFTVTSGLRKNYLDRGLKDPYAMNKVYASSPVWGKHVNFFINDISKFESEFKQAKNQEINGSLELKIAGASAQVKTFKI